MVTALVVLVAAIAASSAYLAGANIERYFNRVDMLLAQKQPVIVDMRIAAAEDTKDATRLHIMGKKQRFCGPPESVAGTYGGGTHVLTSITFLDDARRDGTFQPPDAALPSIQGKEIDFGVWELRPKPHGQLLLWTYHACTIKNDLTNDLEITYVKSLIGPFEEEEYR